EIYALLTGEGDYNDNGTIRPVRAADVTFCPDGELHGLKNTGSAPLELIAFIGHDK
ncbi:MAG: cupin domain-containing protein, partial [Oscillospiraceae bacterium]